MCVLDVIQQLDGVGQWSYPMESLLRLSCSISHVRPDWSLSHGEITLGLGHGSDRSLFQIWVYLRCLSSTRHLPILVVLTITRPFGRTAMSGVLDILSDFDRPEDVDDVSLWLSPLYIYCCRQWASIPILRRICRIESSALLSTCVLHSEICWTSYKGVIWTTSVLVLITTRSHVSSLKDSPPRPIWLQHEMITTIILT